MKFQFSLLETIMIKYRAISVTSENENFSIVKTKNGFCIVAHNETAAKTANIDSILEKQTTPAGVVLEWKFENGNVEAMPSPKKWACPIRFHVSDDNVKLIQSSGWCQVFEYNEDDEE